MSPRIVCPSFNQCARLLHPGSNLLTPKGHVLREQKLEGCKNYAQLGQIPAQFVKSFIGTCSFLQMQDANIKEKKPPLELGHTWKAVGSTITLFTTPRARHQEEYKCVFQKTMKLASVDVELLIMHFWGRRE